MTFVQQDYPLLSLKGDIAVKYHVLSDLSHSSLTLQSTAKKHREAALEKLLEKHPVDNVLNDLKALLDTATQHMPTTTTLKRVSVW